MPEKDEILSVVAQIDLDNWRTNADKVIADAGKLDSLSDIEVSAKFDADTSELDAALNKVSDLDAETINVSVSSDDSELDVTVGKVSDLDASSADIAVSTDDSEVDTTAKKVEDLDSATADVKVTADDSELRSIQDQLEAIKTLSVVNLVLNLPDTLNNLGSLPGISAVNDKAKAESYLGVQSGGVTDPKELELAEKIYTNAFAGSVTEGAIFINQLKSIGVESENLEEAAFGALNAQAAFTAMGQEADLNSIALAQNALVLNGLAENHKEAADIIAAGVAGGANRKDDFLDTIIEYSSALADFGLTAEETLAIFNTGLDAGFDNTDRIADVFREFNLRVANPDETATQDALKTLGLGDEKKAYEAGELSAAEFFKGVVDALKAQPDAGKQQKLATDIFGTQAEDFGTSTVLDIDPLDKTLSDFEGKAAEISTVVNDNLDTLFTELFNTINVKAGELLSSEAIDIPGKIALLKTGVTDAINALVAGESLETAITIGLEPLGVDDEFTELQSILGNFVIDMASALASLLEAIPGDQGESGLRAQIATQAQKQLTYDLKFANENEIPGIVKTALDRGVAESDVSNAAAQAAVESVESGNGGQAQTILDNLERTSVLVSTTIAGLGQPVQTVTQGIGESFEDFQKRLMDYKASVESLESNPAGGTVTFETIEIPQAAIDEAQEKVNQAINQKEGFHAFDTVGGANPTPTSGASEPDVTAGFKGFDTAVLTTTDNLATSAEDYMTSAQNVTLATDNLHISADDYAVSTQDVADAAGQANAANVLLSGSFAEQAAQLAELETLYNAGTISLDQFNVSMGALIETAKMAADYASAGGGVVNNNGNTVNTTMYTSSQAEGTSAATQIVTKIKGG